MKSLILAVLFLSAATAVDARSYSHHYRYYARTYGEADLETHHHYVNVSGNLVHSPSRTYSGMRPAGAPAQCLDGSWSFSQHARGTCSHHGGVAHW
jgi:hypothetical protein